MAGILSLLLGVKRSRFRENDPRRARADAEFSAKRPIALAKHNYICQGCGYESKVVGNKASQLDIHHLDDNHHNNDSENLIPACHTCHPYQHVGELARRADVPGEGLGKATLIAAIPEIDPSDLNLLQRAIGVALLDEKQAPFARLMVEQLSKRAIWVKAEFGTFWPTDFAAAMAALTPQEYEDREDAITDLRLLFNEETLKKLGREMMLDYPTMPVSSWTGVSQGVAKKSQPH